MLIIFDLLLAFLQPKLFIHTHCFKKAMWIWRSKARKGGYFFFLFFSNGITILRTKSIFCLLVIATEWKISARCLVKFRPLSTNPKSLIILIRHHISIPRNTTQWLLYSKYQNIVFRILYYSYAIQAIWLHLLIKSWGPCMLEWKLSFP